ncbi:MAG: hypothetical protein H0X63_05780 [Flavobacteriales bacterium]|jgi:hypothetical protein|nr:hypothetical protein [Flavobacteriales bacterium]
MYKKVFLIIILCLLLSGTMDAQCAMCRAVLESEGNEDTARGINNGIVYLMAFPYLLVGTIGFFIYRSRKKAKKEGTT